MQRSVAEEHLRLWHDGNEKIYRYRREFVPPEFVVYRKTGGSFAYPDIVYKINNEKSTYKLGDLPQDDFIKLLCNEELVYEKDYMGWNSDVLKLKTGGCDCGVWIIRDSEGMHNDKCPLYRRPPK